MIYKFGIAIEIEAVNLREAWRELRSEIWGYDSDELADNFHLIKDVPSPAKGE